MTSKWGYKVFLECIDFPVLVIDLELQIVYCNSAYARIAGKTAQQLMGKRLLDIMPELAGSSSHQAYLKVLSTGVKTTTKFEIANTHYQEKIYPLPKGLISIIDDVSDLSKFEGVVKSLSMNYHEVLDEIWNGVFILDVYTADIIEANQAACDIFGYSREELLKMDMGELCVEEAPYTSDELKRWLRMASQEKSLSLEFKVMDNSGRQFWMEIRTRRIRLGEKYRLLAVVRDITTLRLSTEKLRESRLVYEEFFDRAGDIIFSQDMGGNLTSINPAAQRITGYTVDELVRMNLQDLADVEYLKLLRGFQYHRLAIDQKVNYEFGIRTKDGEKVYLDVCIWPVYRKGKPVAVRGIARDITRHKIQLQELQISEQNLWSMVEWLPDATLAIDTEGKVVAWNRAMEELTGIKAEDMLGKGNYEYSLAFYNTKRPIMVDVVLKPEEISRYYSLVEVNNYTVISEFPTPHLRQDSHNLWGRAMPWYDKDGKILGAIECLRDITERYQYTDGLNKQLDKNQKDIQHLYSVLNNLDSSLISCTGGGNIKFVSDNLSQRLGYDSGELSGRKLSDFMTPKSSRELKDSLKAAVPSAINICLVHKDGSKHDVAMEIKPLPPEGRTKNYMLLVKDI